MTASARRAMLENFVAQNPNDAFGRYGLAMECVSGGDLATAESHFAKLVETNPQYVPTYYHYGQLLARLEKTEEVRRIIRAGMDVAKRAGDSHAFSELEQSLRDLG